VISPLLANIALHGMEAALQQAYTVREGKPALIRYADDFVVLHPSLQGVEKARTIVEHWLKGIGLEWSPQKTKITHTLSRYEGHVGFDLPLANRAAVPSGQNPLWEKRQRPAPGIQDLHHSQQGSHQAA
jgi:RNA-directed DNA polymerase